MLKFIINKFRWIPVLLLVMALCGCEDWCGKNRKREYDDVLIYYAAGYNSLSSFLKSDFNDLKKGYIPRDANGEDVLIAYVHVKTADPSPVLLRLYKDKYDKVVTDTLAVYDKSTISSSAAQLAEVLCTRSFRQRGMEWYFRPIRPDICLPAIIQVQRIMRGKEWLGQGFHQFPAV